MTFGQLIKYNMRNIFLEKSYMLEKLFPDHFLEIQNWANSIWFEKYKCDINHNCAMGKPVAS